jgi:hypothetical protein
MNEKKPRQSRVGLDFNGETTITGIRQNEDGSLTFFGIDGKPLQVYAGFAGMSYDRVKGPKVTFQIPDQGEAIGSLTTLTQYSQIIGGDTNYCEYQGEKVCVTAIAKLRDLKFEGPRWSCAVDPIWALEFWEPQKDAERIGWRYALVKGEKLGWLHEERTTLLVVDAYLDDLHKINQRKSPLIDDFLLPNSVSIAYASADCATDSPLNALITCCDRLASEVLNHITGSSSGLGPPTAAERTPFRACRYWEFESR